MTAGGGSGASDRRRLVLVLLIAAILLVAVAIGARAAFTGAALPPGASAAWLDALYAVLGVAAGGLIALLVAALITGALRRQKRGPDERERERPTRPVYVLLFIGGFAFAVLWLLLRAPRRKYGVGPSPVSRAGRAPSGGVAGPVPSSPTALVVGIVVGIVIVAVAALYLLLRARTRPAPPLPLPDEPSPLLGAVDAAVLALDSDADPRRAVIAAYATMERLLAAAGSPRRASDAPTEHLERSLILLGSSLGSARRLTELFERARFSLQTIDEQLREAAFQALAAVRSDLESG
ncbi:MAG: DUF4129 domain-containing protein [Candidatus Dormibacteria bacterium]|jgi:hypothetical protein